MWGGIGSIVELSELVCVYLFFVMYIYVIIECLCGVKFFFIEIVRVWVRWLLCFVVVSVFCECVYFLGFIVWGIYCYFFVLCVVFVYLCIRCSLVCYCRLFLLVYFLLMYNVVSCYWLLYLIGINFIYEVVVFDVFIILNLDCFCWGLVIIIDDDFWMWVFCDLI